MMLNSKIHPPLWQTFFDSLSKALPASPKYVRLRRVIPGKAGTYDAAHWLPLVGITYDARDGALYIMLDGLTHRVHQPGEIWASVTADGVYTAFLVLCRDGSKVSVELSDRHFPTDPSLYRRDPSSRSLARWKDRTSVMWRRLVPALPRNRRRQDQASEGDVHDSAGSSRSLRPNVHRRGVRPAAPGDASRPPDAYRRALPMEDLPWQKRRPERTTRPLRPPPSIARSRVVDPALPNTGDRLCGEVQDLYEVLTQTQETLQQEQERIQRVLHHPLPGYSRDARRDLLHVHARLDGLQAQAAHTVRLVQRLMASSTRSPAPPPEVILQEV